MCWGPGHKSWIHCTRGAYGLWRNLGLPREHNGINVMESGNGDRALSGGVREGFKVTLELRLGEAKEFYQ